MKDTFVEEGAAFLALEGRALAERGASRAPREAERFEVIVIGGGQAGLSVGYHLARRGVSFVILDANERVGDAWRRRWDSLRLFTPAIFDGLDGMPFPAPPFTFPTKDEMADYLEAYARRFALPVRNGLRVERLRREGEIYVATTSSGRFEAPHVVVAMASYQSPRIPSFATELLPGIVQIHSRDYRNPSQLPEGGVLVAGGGNSGADIALEVARGHRTFMAGRDTGQVPFRIEGLPARLGLTRLVLRLVFHRLLTTKTRFGRRARLGAISKGAPLIRVKAKDLAAAGVERVARVAGVVRGMPRLEDGRVLDVASVVWCTGFHPGFSWIDLPILDPTGEPIHERGLSPERGLYFVGLHFLYAFSSTMIHGVGRDARHVAETIVARQGVSMPAQSARRPAAA